MCSKHQFVLHAFMLTQKNKLSNNILRPKYNHLIIPCLFCDSAFREGETEGAALAFLAPEQDGAALGDDHFFGHKESQAGAVRPGALGVVGAEKLAEQMRLVAFGHTDAAV